MTTKRTPIGRPGRLQISPAAVRRWRAIRPWGLGPRCIDDHELGEALGQPALLAMRPDDLAALRQALDAALDVDGGWKG